MFQRFFIAAAAAALASTATAADKGPPPIEAYGRLPQSEAFELSPSGNRLAFVAQTAEGRAIYVMEDGKLALRVKLLDKNDGKGAESKIRGVGWADEDHVLVETSKTYNLGLEYGFKHEISQIFVMNLKTHKGFYLFEHDAKKFGVFGNYGYASKNGHPYGYFESQSVEDGRLTGAGELYKVDLDTEQSERVAFDTVNPKEWIIDRTGAILANSDYDTKSGEWRLYGGAHQSPLIAEGKTAFEGDAIEGQGRTVGTVLYLRQDGDNGSDIYEAPLTGGGGKTKLFENLEAASPVFARDTGLLIGAHSGGPHPDMMFFDPHREAVWKGTKKAFPGLNVTLLSYSTDFNTLVVETDGDGDAGTYWTVNIATGKANPFGYAYPDVDAAAVGLRKYVQYKAADGLEIEGVLTLPPGREAKNLPVVVFPHGGPRSNDDVGFDWWAGAFASRGYAVFQPNFRGSTGYGVEFEQAGYGQWGRKMQTDVSDGLAALASQGVIDPKRACIMGASYGGYVALAGVTVQQGLYRCAVSVAGVSDLRAMLADQAEKVEVQSPEVRYWKTAMGAKTITDPALTEISPAKLAKRADAPILLIHGKDDTTVPIEQSREMERDLKAAGKPVEFVELDGEDHHLSRETTRIAMLKAAVAFVEKYNPPN
ncbi:MAG TPA: S9 family peptidase [Caulobacteraceae bacterium]|jgi:acetyl esterase/lipase|nr:S9 family peptidase [Caulobacteraceae bacterium]